VLFRAFSAAGCAVPHFQPRRLCCSALSALQAVLFPIFSPAGCAVPRFQGGHVAGGVGKTRASHETFV
jgi:hypothetical protein